MCSNLIWVTKYVWESTAESSKCAFKEYSEAIAHLTISHKCIILNHAIKKPDQMKRNCWYTGQSDEHTFVTVL